MSHVSIVGYAIFMGAIATAVSLLLTIASHARINVQTKMSTVLLHRHQYGILVR